MMQDHAAGMDICLVGEKVGSVSHVKPFHVRLVLCALCTLTGRWQKLPCTSFCRAAGIPPANNLLLQGRGPASPRPRASHCKSLYAQDLLARDLLQRRTTDQAGQTEWHDSALVQVQSFALLKSSLVSPASRSGGSLRGRGSSGWFAPLGDGQRSHPWWMAQRGC